MKIRMKKNIKIIFVALLMFSAWSCTQEKIDVFLMGDSTMAEYNTFYRPLTGWGEKLDSFFNDNVTIHNFAVSGSSTKRFRDRLMWRKVRKCLRKGSYLLIQFGHNDADVNDTTQYAAASGAYNENLKRYIIEAREEGAIPILLTPISRREFDDKGNLKKTHGKYPAEMRKVAKELNVPIIDLAKVTKTLIKKFGIEGSKKLFSWAKPGEYPAYPDGKEDNTHLSELGALEVSKLVAQGIKGLDLELKEYLTKDVKVSSKKKDEAYIKFDDTREVVWDKDFKIAEIKSSADDSLQKAYFYTTNSKEPQPLVVSLHTWSGDFTQVDDLAEMCKTKDINYIHPNFRGPNWTKNACCSKLALADIDDAIDYAIENSNVDTSKIYVIGVSGGGYATLSMFMKSKHNIAKFSAWASISDLNAWYNESKIRGRKYAEQILKCTESGDKINIESAKMKSPIFWDTPSEKLKNSQLDIHVGVYDGIQGSVPITHSINFYNKLLKDLGVTDKEKYVSVKEKAKLFEFRKPLGNFGNIGDRKICLQKKYGNIKLTVFVGNHEMLTEYAFNELLK